ncbi:MAG: hypothetical protein Q8S57_09470 [Methanoregula sp.]|nr:hypothetical protein [Methanoregula sp.]
MNPVYRQPISSQEPCIIITGLNDNTFSGIINEKVTLAFDYFKGPQK